MDTRIGSQMGLALVLLTLLWHGAMAQSGCTTVLMRLVPCLNYITGNSSTPSSSCCSQLANVLQSQPACLCTAINNGGAGLGIMINQTLALELPGACNVKAPPVSQCNAASGPATSAISPESSPADSSGEAPDETPATESLPSMPSAASGPATSAVSPESSPADSSGETPATESPPSMPSGTRSKSVPAKDGSSISNETIMGLPPMLTILALLIASYASTFTGC